MTKPSTKPVITCDVAVIGAGSAGIAAALAAARAGAETCLIERLPFVGGMASAAEVGTICGLYYQSAQAAKYVIGGFTADFAEQLADRSKSVPTRYAKDLWFLAYQPSQFILLAEQLLTQTQVKLFLHSTLYALDKDQHRISALHVFNWDRNYTFVPKMVIDCSGQATVARSAQDPLLKIEQYQAGAIVFTLAGFTADALPQLSTMITLELLRAVKNGLLPEAAQRISIVPGSQHHSGATFKLSLPSAMQQAPNFISNLELEARALVSQIVSYLKKNVAACQLIELSKIATHCGIRSGERAQGQYVLSRQDLLEFNQFEDRIARAAWPIELWGQDRQPSMLYLGEHRHYDIPLGCLRSSTTANLLMAGRCISATEEALASARVIATCLSTGYAAGTLAAKLIQGKELKQIITEIQTEQGIYQS